MAGRSMALDVLVRLRDNLSGPLRRLRSNLASVIDVGRRIGIVGAAIGAISFLAPIREAAAFQQKLLDIAGTAELAGKAAFDFVDKQSARYEALALKIGQSSDMIAVGAGQMIAAGIGRDVIDQTIEDIGRASTAANASFSDMASVGTSMLQNLKLPADQMSGALGGLVVAGKEGAFELKDMAASFSGLTTGVAKFGVKGREAVNFLAAALQIARKGTSDPGQAANNLGNFLDKALSPLTKKNFQKHGVDIEAVMRDAAVKGINPIEAMVAKIDKLTGVSEQSIAKMMAKAKKNGLEGADALASVREQLEAIGAAGKIGELFQDKQVLDFLIPFLANIDEYKRIKADVAAATGAIIDPDFETQMAGLNRQLTILDEIGVQAVRELGRAFGTWLPSINSGLAATLKWLRDLDASTGGMVSQALRFAGAGLLVVAALGALGVALPIVGAGLSAIVGLVGLVLSPLGVLVALAAGAAALIWKNWDRIGPRLKRLWTGLKESFGGFARGAVETWHRYQPALQRGFERTWRYADAAMMKFGAGFASGSKGIGKKWGDLVDKLEGIGGKLKGIFGDLGDLVTRMMPSLGDLNWESLGKMLGQELNNTLDTVNKLATGLGYVLDNIKGVTEWLKKADANDWKKLFSDSAATVVRAVSDALSLGSAALGEIVSWFEQAGKFAWENFFPETIAGTINGIAAAINSVISALKALKDAGVGGALAFPGVASGGAGAASPDPAARAGAAVGGMVGAPPPAAAPAALGKQSALETGRRFAAVVPPVRVGGNVSVAIRVEGPGKVTSATSDNANVKVAKVGNNGRMVGTV